MLKSERFIQGYEFAKEYLEKKNYGVESLQHALDCAYDFGDYDDFDAGIASALRELHSAY
jgi:hypothetical protein